MKTVPIRKIDEELQIVYGEVYAPDVVDAHGDMMTAEEIRKAAHRFLASRRTTKVDVNHDNNIADAVVVESFIAREDDPVFIPGSWVVGVHIADPDLWDAVKSGDLNGFSMQALAKREPVGEIEIEIPESVSGETEPATEGDPHTHRFTVYFDEDGKFAGGETNTVKGHKHRISRGTVTEEVEGHSHRYSFLELLLNDG